MGSFSYLQNVARWMDKFQQLHNLHPVKSNYNENKFFTHKKVSKINIDIKEVKGQI